MLGDLVITGRQRNPRRTILYGVHGVGKSTWAAKAKSPIFVPTEDGLSSIDCSRFPQALTFSDVLKYVAMLITEEHEHKTIVIDSLDWLERMIWHDVAEQHGKESIEDFGYGKGYVICLDAWRRLLDGLDMAREKRGMEAILIAHSHVERFTPPDLESYDRYAPKLNKHASALLQEWADEVLFVNYSVHTTKQDEGFGRKRARGVSDGERVLFTAERATHVAKNRLGLPAELPFDQEAYQAAITESFENSPF